MILYPLALSNGQPTGPLVDQVDPDTLTALTTFYGEVTASLPDPDRLLSIEVHATTFAGVSRLVMWWPDDMTAAERSAADAVVAAHMPK